MIHEHFAEAITGPEVVHPVRVSRLLPRLFVCGEATAEEIDSDALVERLLPTENALFIDDQKFGYCTISDGYRNATARDILRGMRFD